MTDKEILAGLKKSYEHLRDISENACVDHSNKQLEETDISEIYRAMESIAEVYNNVREQLTDDKCMINLESGTYYIGNTVSEDYGELYDNDNNAYCVSCGDLDYCWYEDTDFLEQE